MGITCGIVGLPNVGKSTLFNALTAAGVAADNYPFCTIDPHAGVAIVPDPRLDAIAAIVQPGTVVPAAVEFVDIAGLVAGAHEGEGLGNRFLHHIRETDAIAHVVRCFRDPNVAHVTGNVDPVADVETVNTELILADLESVERALEKTERRARAGERDAQAAATALETVREHLDRGEPVRTLHGADALQLPDVFLLTGKPVMYVANVAEGDDDNHLVAEVGALAEKEHAGFVVIAAELEAELLALDEGDRAEMLAAYDVAEPGRDRVIHATYDLLDLVTFFTYTTAEARAWPVPRGTAAPQAAGRIHTDFERGFIRAEVVHYDDFLAHDGEHGAREAGTWRIEGRDYVVQDGDVIYFRFNV
jgi:GTP-binding protein YchF